MQFQNSQFIFLVPVVLFLLIFFFWWAFKRRKKLLTRFSTNNLIAQLTEETSYSKRKIKTSLLVLGILLCLIALLQPQWGFHWREVKRKGLDILIAVDTSKSMLANDVKPNRLERAKLAIKDLVKKLSPGDRIGLIAFSGNAFLQCPLTVDYNGFLLALNDISSDIIPKGGTSIASAINEAIITYSKRSSNSKILICITDGEDHEGDAIKSAEKAKKEKINIYCIGIGTSNGELISITDDKGGKTFLKDIMGNFVKSRLDEVLLKKIAMITGGSYIKAGAIDFGLDYLYNKKLSKYQKTESKSNMKKQYKERYQIPLCIAFLLFILEMCISEVKTKNRGKR